MRTLAAVLLVSVCFVCSACSPKKEAPPPAKAGRISATKAFETYFGPAPTTDKGTCYAFVIYFPAAAAPGKVVPFPFFTFDEGSMKKVALERLISGMDQQKYQGQFLQLFPPGSRLLSVAGEGVATANFSKEVAPVAADKEKSAALQNSVTLTLMQFAGVTGARIQSEGRDLFPADAAPPAEASVVQQPSPPRLLNVIASKEAAAAQVAEIDALFDRPVQIQQCQFTTVDGKPLEGTVYHSMFDMAAVLKPKDPMQIKPGTVLRVRFRVTDKMGRSAAGEEAFPVQVMAHQD